MENRWFDFGKNSDFSASLKYRFHTAVYRYYIS